MAWARFQHCLCSERLGSGGSCRRDSHEPAARRRRLAQRHTIREDGDSGEWQDRLVDDSPDQETTLAASEEFDNRRKTLSSALTVLNKRERRIFETRRLAEEQITLVELALLFADGRNSGNWRTQSHIGRSEN
jgi:hypothetical protein